MYDLATLFLDAVPLNGWQRAFMLLPICLCSIAGLPLPQFVTQIIPQAVESESPWEEKEETSEEVVAGSSVRRRVRTVGKTRLCRATNVAGVSRKISSCAGRLRAIVGHEFPNGLRAPLRI